MPSELFGGVTSRVSSATSGRTRSSIVAVSIGVHIIVFLTASFLSLSSPGALPTPRVALAFVEPPTVKMMDIPLSAPAPARPVTASDAVVSSLPTVEDPNLPPVIAPTGITPPTGLEGPPMASRPADIAVIEGNSNAGMFGRGLRVDEPPVPPAPAPVRLHSGMKEPQKVFNVEPAYPVLAQSARVQGVVILEAVIDRTGKVESVQVLRSIPLLDQAAVTAVRQWRYRPATVNESPVPVIVTVTVKFELER